MEEILNQKPCVVQKIETPQGFSVSYKGHLLYSKYNPSKNIITAVEKLQILPGTIILCCSPLLGYGLSELLNKLPENCLIILCEADSDLYDFSKREGIFNQSDSRITSCHYKKLSDLPLVIYDLVANDLYKRVIKFDLSAGTQFHQDFYSKLFTACSDSLMTFWKNRITLTKFGRRYSKNLFENLHYLSQSQPITDYFNSVDKPIIVFGAGQSTEALLKTKSISKDDYFILCADTALQPLLKHGIRPDGVFIEEAQAVISKAFIGIPKDIHIFAGLSSIPNLVHKHGPKNLSYFFTEYTNTGFLDNLKTKTFMPPSNKPFGSVGLTAVYYALKFRKNEDVPVYVTGLDFSYSVGVTHTKGALAHILRLINSSRLQSIENYTAAFGTGSEKIIDKNQKIFITTPSLKNYANMFNNFFANEKNLFDAGESGIVLNIQKAQPQAVKRGSNTIQSTTYSENQKKEIQQYLESEKKSLEYLKDLLTGKTALTGNELTQKIIAVAENREYLYLHFADGSKFTTSQSFLNRIRTEIDFFLKYL